MKRYCVCLETKTDLTNEQACNIEGMIQDYLTEIDQHVEDSAVTMFPDNT